MPASKNIVKLSLYLEFNKPLIGIMPVRIWDLARIVGN